MGQSKPRSADSEPMRYSLFETPLGWWGIVGFGGILFRSYCGFSEKSRLSEAVEADAETLCAPQLSALKEADWLPTLRQRLQRFTHGTKDSFSDVQLQLPPLTAFQKSVLATTRKIPLGKTLTYGELAAKAGYPRAARAVGSVMASNRFPIIIPCHRVVASGGGLGGYTNPVGVPFKVQLLQLEAEMIESRPNRPGGRQMRPNSVEST